MAHGMAKRWQTHRQTHAIAYGKRHGKSMDLHLHQYLPTVVFGFAGRKCGEPHPDESARSSYLPIHDRTGWPPTNLMQDDCRELSLWLATRLGARQLVRQHHASPTHLETL